MMRTYQRLAQLMAARDNCRKSGNTEWGKNHAETIRYIVAQRAPSGSGFDFGTQIDVLGSTSERLVFITAFHHMNGDGFYCGWTNHLVIVTPSLAHDFNLRITGRDYREIKELIHTEFQSFLGAECTV